MNKARTLLNGDLRREFGDAYFKRGEAYFRDGLVLSQKELSYKNNRAVIEGHVTGRASEPYTQHISILWDSENHLLDIVGDCSCPLHFNCKHVVAVCLAYRTEVRRASNRAKSGAEFEWLENVQKSGQLDNSLTNSPDTIVYLLSQPDSNQAVQVELKVSRRLKNGDMGTARKIGLSNILNPFLRPAYASRLDADITRLLMASDNDSWQNQKALRSSAGALALEKMIGCGRCYWESSRHTALTPGAKKTLDIYWQEQSGDKLKLMLSAGKNTHLVLTDPPLYVDPEKGEAGKLDTMGLNAEQLQQLMEAPQLAHDQAQEFSRLLVKRYSDLGIPPPRKIEVKKLTDVRPTPVLELDRITDKGQSRRCIRPKFKYQDWVLPPCNGQAKTLIEDGDKLIEITRVEEDETSALAHIHQLGFTPQQQPDNQALIYVTPGDDAGQHNISLWANFLDQTVPELQSMGWDIRRMETFNLDFYQADQYWGEIQEETHDWFNLRLDIEINGQRISLLKLLLPLLGEFEPDQLPDTIYIPLNETNYISVSADEIRPYLQTLYELYDSSQPNEDHLRLSRYDAALINELENQTDLKWQGNAFLRELGEKLSHFEGIEHCPAPEGFLGELRDYQEAGLDWLAFLREYHLNGILADDMGLGKTVQTVAHIQNEKQSGRLTLPVLVIAPTSLMGNWRREIQAFAPMLKVVVLQGPERHQHFASIANVDVILTTYPLLPRDADTLLAQQYHLLVLDEAQLIKNPRAKAAQVVRKLDTRHRLCLTGTPMENHLGELWAQFDFLMPGFLGNLKTFKRVYQNPIEKHGDIERREQLSRRVAPFMLRRKKDEVETALPPKTEMIRSVPLGKTQAALYETIRLSMESRVRETIASKGLARSHITILDALLKLRQTCCDPRLLKLQQAQKVKESAKLEMLMSMLPELLEEGRRVLVFSQFVSMLKIIEAQLDDIGIKYLKLTGETRKRDEVIDQFNQKEADVFLISLKAGGVGLNLTSADTVILYDPWWNPAVEAQAMDRTHRIGQEKPVFVYKLLTEGTVEEKILVLQEQKKALANGIYGNSAERNEPLNKQDIQVLFEPLS